MRKSTKNFLLVLLIGVAVTSSVLMFNTIDGPSVPPDDEEIPLFDIAEHGVHSFEAVNDEIQLAATVLPADADDLTVVWTTSDATAVNILGSSALANVSTATLKCLRAFGGESVTITARATNGTVTETDDFTATCVCSFYVAVSSIDLQLWEVSNNSEGTAIESYNTQIIDFVDLPVDPSIYYAFKVVVLPSIASDISYNVSAIYDGADDFSSFVDGDLLTGAEIFQYDDSISFLFPFTFYSSTLPQKSWTLTVTSVDNVLATDSISISVGNHYVSSNKTPFTPSISINSDSTPIEQTVAQLESRFLDEENQVQNPLSVGSCFEFQFIPNGFVSPALTITYEVDYFEINTINAGAVDNLNGTITISMTSPAIVEFKSIASTGSDYPSYISIKPSFYSTVLSLDIPFAFRQSVTGISVGNSTLTF